MEGETSEEMAEEVNFTPVQSGFTRWRWHTFNDDEIPDILIPPETEFSVSIDLSPYKVGDIIVIYSLARTDQDWTIGESLIPAQSNFVNARTNPQWSHVHASSIDGGSLIKGRLDWFSVPVTIEIGKCKYIIPPSFFVHIIFSKIRLLMDNCVKCELGPQPGFFERSEPIETSIRLSDEWHGSSEKSQINAISLYLAMAVIVVFVTVFCVFCREERDGTVCVVALFSHLYLLIIPCDGSSEPTSFPQDICSIWTKRRRINSQRIKLDDFFRDESLELTTIT